MKNWKSNSLRGLSALLVGVFCVGAAVAQSDYYGNADPDDLVVIYEHCDFKGASRALDVGEFRNMREIGFGNDSMSSIRVPRDLEVTIFEDDNYGGAYARIDRDIHCFDKYWNDKVSSLRIEETGYRNRPRRDHRQYDDRHDGPGIGDRRYGEPDRPRNYQLDNSVTGKNVSQVVFGNSVLQQVSKKQWQINSPRGGVSQYREVNRDKNSVYLQNNYTAERIRIDTFANDVTFTDREGRQQRYRIVRKQKALNGGSARNQNPSSNGGQNRTIHKNCFSFSAHTDGGNGGLRFHGKEKFYRFGKKAVSDRICHNGSLTMEINKTDPNTKVVVNIEGNRYVFGRNEPHDVLLNNWYRKKVRLKVGR